MLLQDSAYVQKEQNNKEITMKINVAGILNQPLAQTSFARTIITNYKGTSKMIEQFNSIFGDYADFSNELCSIVFFPINLYNSETYGEFDSFKPLDWAYSIKACEPLPEQYCYLLGGTHIKPKYNNFLDYKGYTYIKAFLPFLGYVDIDVNECMDRWLYFALTIDFKTGQACYMIGTSEVELPYREDNPTILADQYILDNLRIFATFDFQLGLSIPIGRSNIGDISRNILMTGAKAAVSIASMGYTQSLPPAQAVTTTTKTYDIMGRSTRKGSRMKQIKSGTETTEGVRTYNKPKDYSGGIEEAIDCGIDCLNRNYPSSNTDRVGSSSLLYSLSTKITVTIYRPKALNLDYSRQKLIGKPVGSVYRLSDMSGLTVISEVQIQGSSFSIATSDEIDELKAILTSSIGIILPEKEEEELHKFNLHIIRDTELYSPEIDNITFYSYPSYSWINFVNSSYNVNNTFSIKFIADTYVTVEYGGRYFPLSDKENLDILKTSNINESNDYYVYLDNELFFE